nr:hypothetical protein [Tanacetum cinerariifolium]
QRGTGELLEDHQVRRKLSLLSVLCRFIEASGQGGLESTMDLSKGVHKEGQGSYWKIIRLGGSSACYQFFVDLSKHLDREDLNQLWILVKEYLSIGPASSDKEMELWVELKRLYEPDPEDQLDCQRQRDFHASREGLSSEEGSSPCNDLLQASSREFFTDGK